MAVIYVREQGAYIKKIDKRILITKNCTTLAEIPIINISNLSVFGNVQVSTQALQLLMTSGIDVSFFAYSGKLLGHMSAGSSKNVFLRLAQYELYDNIESRLLLAKTIISSKIQNQIAVIKSFNWRGIEYDYSSEVKQLNSQLNILEQKNTNNQLMGLEGNCSAIYFRVYAQMFRSEIKFVKRNRRPPRDPVNVLLSLGYTLLTKEVTAALESESFETYMGFLHGIRYGRQSLALDIVEEFRQPIVDRLVVRLFNKGMMSKFDFVQEEDRVILTEEGFKKFCKEYEKWLTDPSCKNDDRSFRTIIQEQVNSLKKKIMKKEMYIPYRWGDENVSG